MHKHTMKLAAAVTCALALTACGSDGGSDSSTPSEAASSSSTTSANGGATSTSEQAGGSSTNGGSSTAAAGNSLTVKEVTVKDGGPTGVKTWPVPAEATLDELAGPFNGSWQFSLSGVPSDQIISFYEKELTKRGYKVVKNYKAKIGVNELPVALGWSGNAAQKQPYGTVTEDKLAGGVMVAITSRPSDLSPK
ncbi:MULTISPECIES: hypothetical protein [Yimella]|uniref:Lipoprotein n=1 Tax=Yimella lutea TaxID=587872 RepID=A0A542EJF9_9MICO|nr:MULTISPECIES: hypothetical protein [Yimella]MCG8656824.1 hypothetical protein [Yimella sp. NH-Cas1]RYG76393.1 hypothetical protein EU513_12850 [Yimella sp. RIT 621]TQJ15471.1 hypothetical protein FB459_3027 [Yimella lutea]